MSQQLTFDLQVDNKQAIDSINAFFEVYEKGVSGMSKVMSDALGEPVQKKVTIELQGDKLVAKEVEKTGKAVEAITVAAKAMNGEYGKTPNALKRQLRVLKAIQGDTKKFKDGTDEVTGTWKRLQRVIDGVKEQLDRMGTGGNLDNLRDKLVNSQIAADTMMAAFHALTGAVGSFLKTGMEMEVLFVQLQGFTGGVEQAAAAYSRFVEIGQATPFTAKEVASAARTMMGFGLSTTQAADQVERLSYVAAATGGELNHMARNMGQIQANQKAYTRDLMQFANQGIPIYGELAKILDTNSATIREMAEEGKIGFAEVSLALRNMTKEGSAYMVIADKMDRTFSAKMEAMTSAVESFAGNSLSAISEFDNALGGPLATVLQLVIDLINDASNAFSELSANMRNLAPVLGAVIAGMGTLIGLTIAQNWAGFTAAIKAVLVTTNLWRLGTYALTVAQAILQGLMGNFAVLALAAAAGAAAAAIAVRNNAQALDEQNQALSEGNQMWDANATALDESVFATEQLTGATRELVEEQKTLYDQAREEQQIVKKKAQTAIDWARARLEAEKEGQEEAREAIKAKYDEEKELHKQNLDMIKESSKTIIEAEKEHLAAIRERHNEELGLLDKKSQAELALDKIKRAELEQKLRGLKIGSKEYLETQIRLEQMDKVAQREALRAKQKQEILAQEKKIKEAEGDREAAIKAEKDRHEKRKKHLDLESKALDIQLEKEKKKVDDLQKRYDRYFKELNAAQFESHQDAMSYLDEQIRKYGELEAAAIRAQKAAAQARTAQSQNNKRPTIRDVRIGSDIPGFFTGGPIQGGTTATVNELGKEAFLSASGRLSMINAPSWGQWTAPSSGTVIPAHLTKQLDIPAGGINLNRGASASAARAASGGGSLSQLAKVIKAVSGGDNINNNVTIQATNTTQAASDMLVSLTRVKHRRYGR